MFPKTSSSHVARTLAVLGLLGLCILLFRGNMSSKLPSNTIFLDDMKSSSYDKDHKLWSPNHDDRLQFLFDEYSAEVVYSARSNIIQHEDRFFRLAIDAETHGKRFRTTEVDLCRATTLLNLLEVVQNDRVNISTIYPQFHTVKDQMHQLTVDPVQLDRSLSSSKGEILIVYTTCNQVSMTILSLQYLRNTAKVADIIVVDDHSTDGTVEYLQKKGFAVISKPKATGLTDSWNIGYRLAVALGYKHVLFTNNDVLLTAGAVHLMHHGLKSYPIVVPLTTDKGSGHHKQQSIMKAHSLLPMFGSFVDDYRHAEFIQETLLRKYVYVPKENRRCPSQQSLSAAKRPKFNGFCFGVNIALIEPAAFEPNVHLFDPGDRIVGQEDSLTERMVKANLYPIILHCTFVFHFKSRTVSAANFTLFQQIMHRHNVTIVDSASFPTVRLSYTDPDTGSVDVFRVDIREDLRWYHQEDSSAYESLVSGPSFVQSMLKNRKKEPSSTPAANTTGAVVVAGASQKVSGAVEDTEPDFDVWEGLRCRSQAKDVLFPPAKSHESNKLVNSYRKYPEMSWNIRSNPHCVYPSQWQSHCNKLLQEGSFFEPELYAFAKPTTLTIAIAMSDPVTNPSAGDIFTAYELGHALQTLYSHVRVRYLPRGPKWYSPQLLHDVDVLIALLDQYDLTKPMSLYLDSTVPNYFEKQEFSCIKSYQIKPNLITIAWIRNWFHRWLTKPWFGNYDLILTSSHLSKAFFDQISAKIGIPAACANGCPRMSQGFSSPVLPLQYRAQQPSNGRPNFLAADDSLPFSVNNNNNYNYVYDNEQEHVIASNRSNQHQYRRYLTEADSSTASSSSSSKKVSVASAAPRWTFFTPRLPVRSYTYPLATSIRHVRRRGNTQFFDSLFSIPTNATIQARELFDGVDYVFTGSYFNAYRRIMEFDPGMIPQWKGRIVGNNWDRANVTRGWKQICTGLLPYDTVKESYKYVQIVIDDANHATFPWGSTNSRVFDAVASGALIISNGDIGMREIFGEAVAAKGLQLPIYKSGVELGQLLDYYLSHDVERLELVSIMQDVVFRHHSYYRRAEQLSEMLAENFNIHFERKKGAPTVGAGLSEVEKELLPPTSAASKEDEHQHARNKNNNNNNNNNNSGGKRGRRRKRKSARTRDDEEDDDTVSQNGDGQQRSRSLAAAPEAAATAAKPKPKAAAASTAAKKPAAAATTAAAKPAAKPAASTSAAAAVAAKGKPVAKPTTAKGKANTSTAAASKAALLRQQQNPPGRGLCIGVRTTSAHEEWLPVFVRSVIVQHSSSKYRDIFPIQFFLADTEAETDFTRFLMDLADKHNERFRYPYVHVLLGTQTAPKGIKNSIYGYDDTDRLLDLMLSIRRCSNGYGAVGNTGGNATSGGLSKVALSASQSQFRAQPKFKHATTSIPLPTCEWLLFTNGDNMYNKAWLKTVAPLALSEKYDVIGWDFVTHHPRGPKNDTPNQRINVALERGFVDLASVMVRAELFGKTNVRFLQESIFTKDMFARDFMALKNLFPASSPERMHMIHQILLLHQ